VSEHGRHSIEAGYARGRFWRQGRFVAAGEPVSYRRVDVPPPRLYEDQVATEDLRMTKLAKET
jgi:hypothetical protein